MAVNPKFWKNKKVFITGHSGFKGSWLCATLKTFGANVFGYSLHPKTEPSIFKVISLEESMESVFNDIRDFNQLQKTIKEFSPEIVLHLAAQPLISESLKDPLETYTINIIGTVNLLEAIKTLNSIKAVVIVTSDKCYKEQEKFNGYAEEDELGGNDPYSTSKACVELVVKSYQHSFFNNQQMGVATARTGNVIGGGDWSENRLVPDILQSLITGQKLCVRNLNAVRPWQYVLESISAYLTLAENLYIEGHKFSGAWNFGPNLSEIKPVSWVINEMASLWGKNIEVDEIKQSNFYEVANLKLDNSKAKEQLKWTPTINLSEALQLTVDWTKAYINCENMQVITKEQICKYFHL